MDIYQINIFLLLAKHGNFTVVGDILFTTQSNVSKQIKRLEKELNATLFIRSQSRTILSEEGQLFYPHALAIIENLEDAKKELSVYSKNNTSDFNIGATTLYGETVIFELITQFNKKHPDSPINLTIGSSEQIIQKLEQRQIDLAFLSHYIKYDSHKYKKYKWQHDSLVAIVPLNHPLANEKNISFKQLAHEQFIMKSKESSLSKHIIEEFSTNNITVPFDSIYEVGNQNAIIKAVEYGMGVSIISSLILYDMPEPFAFSVIPLKDLKLEREITYLVPKNHPVDDKLLQFINEFHFDIKGILNKKRLN